MDREKLLKNKESIAEEYSKSKPKSKKLPRLTKKEKKILGIGKDQGVANLNNARVSSTKAKLVLDLIRNKSYEEAYAICKYTPRKASPYILKLLKSAHANAVNNNELDGENLYVAEAYANQGPTMKRIRPRAQGRAFRIRKRTSHITVVLKERT